MEKKYTRQNLWQIFLICAFPFHFWAILMALRDVEWVARRTNFSDAIGVVSYAMIFAFLESFLIFLCVILLDTLILSKLEPRRRLAITSALTLMFTFWAMLTQLYILQIWSVPSSVLNLLSNTSSPLKYIYIIMLILVSLATFFPVLMIYRNEKMLNITLEVINKISLLTGLYLLLDFVALVIVIIRNL